MTAPVNPVLFYHPDGYRVARHDLKGRHSAGESFLTAFLAQTQAPDVFGLCGDSESAKSFTADVAAGGRALTARPIGRLDVAALRQQALLYHPTPGIAQEARIRSFLGDDAYALSGVTHTISSREVLSGVADMLTAPVMPYDALICTSRCVYDALSGVLSRAEEDLRRRLAASKFIRPQMPIIPLGVHADRFKRDHTQRAAWRSKLGISDDTTVVLFFGRLSVHAKASPLQLAQAVEMAAAQSKTQFAIVWCGWFNDDFQRRVFMNTAASMAPSVAIHYVDGRDTNTRFSIWSVADIFCSLSDNIQESFGLTIIEAMAAGLPVIASNWNGYREAIAHGVNGILVDSYLPRVSMADAAYRYVSGVDTYDLYIGALSQLCFVDLDQTASWIVRLANDDALRQKLGTAARRAIETNYDWSKVLRRYLELWHEQRDQIDADRVDPASKRSATWSMHDPAVTFAEFPSHHLSGNTILAAGTLFERWDDLIKQPGVAVNSSVLISRTAYRAIRQEFEDGQPKLISNVLTKFGQQDQGGVLRSLHWLIKIGLLRLVHDQADE
jgi:glycosyltransferase involved in cell wall biosynthesis